MFSFYQCLVEEGQLSQQTVHLGLDGSYVARRGCRAHIDDTVVQEHLHRKHIKSEALLQNRFLQQDVCESECYHLDLISASQNEGL